MRSRRCPGRVYIPLYADVVCIRSRMSAVMEDQEKIELLVRGTQVQIQDENQRWYVGEVVCPPYSIGDEDITDKERFGNNPWRVVCMFKVCMCACVHVCAYCHVCMCVCVYGCMCACVHVCMCACVHVCKCVHVCACVHVCMCACVHVCMCACVYVCMCACVHVCMSV